MQLDYAQNLDTILGLTMNIIRRAYVIYQRQREREENSYYTSQLLSKTWYDKMCELQLLGLRRQFPSWSLLILSMKLEVITKRPQKIIGP